MNRALHELYYEYQLIFIFFFRLFHEEKYKGHLNILYVTSSSISRNILIILPDFSKAVSDKETTSE